MEQRPRGHGSRRRRRKVGIEVGVRTEAAADVGVRVFAVDPGNENQQDFNGVPVVVLDPEEVPPPQLMGPQPPERPRRGVRLPRGGGGGGGDGGGDGTPVRQPESTTVTRQRRGRGTDFGTFHSNTFIGGTSGEQGGGGRGFLSTGGDGGSGEGGSTGSINFNYH